MDDDFFTENSSSYFCLVSGKFVCEKYGKGCDVCKFIFSKECPKSKKIKKTKRNVESILPHYTKMDYFELFIKVLNAKAMCQRCVSKTNAGVVEASKLDNIAGSSK